MTKVAAVTAAAFLLAAGGAVGRDDPPVEDAGVVPSPSDDAGALGRSQARVARLTRQLRTARRELRRQTRQTIYWRRRAKTFRRTLLHRPDVAEAINLACVVYGNCATLWRKADCETGGTFSPTAANPTSSARGLFQFLTTPAGGTWATTPFGRFSVFSPYANAMAAGWMHARGRGGEWVCQ